MPLFLLCKDRFRCHAQQFFTDGIASGTFNAIEIILNVEDGVNKYLGGWELGLLKNNLALYNV